MQQDNLSEDVLRQLTKEKLIAASGNGYMTTARWQASVLRAVSELMQHPETANEDSQDLRIPFAKALHAIYGEQVSDQLLSEMILTMLKLEYGQLTQNPITDHRAVH